MTTSIFKQARERLTIPEAWEMLDLPGEPKPTCRSPFRGERSPSFTIYDNGTKWKDHGEQIGGDVIEFIRHAIGGDHSDVRRWLQERIGTIATTRTTTTAPTVRKAIQYPSKPTEGAERHWRALAAKRGLDLLTPEFMAKFGLLRFLKIDGANCYAMTDAANRNAEIRRMDGESFHTGKKAFPLTGVDKSWLLGADMLRHCPEAHVLLCEGATDFLTAWDMNVIHRRDRANRSHKWLPIALLGAACKALHPECEELLAGRHVRIVPDGDNAGDQMCDHWTAILKGIGCSVDMALLRRGHDLTDLKNEIQPQELFTL